MNNLKKLPSAPAAPSVALALSQLSKAALIDCFLDAMASLEGVDTEELTTEQILVFIAPRLIIRGDRMPKGTR